MLAVLHGAYCHCAVTEIVLPSHILLSHGPEVHLWMQIGQAIMYANYWSLLLPLCRWLLTFQACFSLHCIVQASFLFQFQMSSMSRKGGRTMT